MKVLALAGRLDKRSFGMTAIIVDEGLGDDLICIGLTNASRHRELISKKEFTILLKGGHMTDIAHLDLSIKTHSKSSSILVAGWLGDDFMKESKAVGIPVPDLPQDLNVIKEKGFFWLEDSKILYERMEDWIKLAALRVFKEKNVKLSGLMQWVLPSIPETLAAKWYLKKRSEKNKEIDWQLRTFYRGKSKKTLIAEYKKLIDLYLQNN